MKLSQKTIFTCSTFVAVILLLSFCVYKNVTAESTYPAEVSIIGVALPNGSYLANDSDESTTTKPTEGGYVYYKDGVVTLNNAKICTKDDDFGNTAGIMTDSDITIQVIGNNQIGKTVDSPSVSRQDQLFMGILAADSLYSENFYNITVNGSGNLTIYDTSKGILGKNVTIDINGNLNIIEYGSEDYSNIAECCLKADGGSLYIKSGNLDLRSWLSCCMYADNGIFITSGNIMTRTSSMGGKYAINCEPVFDKNSYTIETSGEFNADASAEMEPWNGKDALSSFYRVNFTNLSTSASAPTPTPTSDVTVQKSISIKKVTWKSLKNKKKKKAVASWKKVSKVAGYQLQYTTNKKFKNKKTVQTKKTKYIIKKLKKRTYYVRVCAYKLDGKKKVYGKWSKVKKVRIKK